MTEVIASSWRQHKWAWIFDGLLFALFSISLLVLFTLKKDDSGWAAVPHLLCNGGLFLLMLRHWQQGRPAMYWSHYDAIVTLLFACFLANVYYSEIREVSWRHAALYLDGFAAYFFGRMLFYHRLRAYGAAMAALLLVAWLSCSMLQSTAVAHEKQLRGQSELASAPAPTPGEASLQDQADDQRAISQNLARTAKATFLLFIFWIITAPFLFLRRPSTIAFLAYLFIVFGGFALYGIAQLSSILTASPSESISRRHDQIESLLTAWRIIQSYPVTGGGLGTFPYLFDAYRLTPAEDFLAGFNAYAYCAVEAGLICVLILLYFLIRFSLHTLRRWRLFLNPRLRFSVTALLMFQFAFAGLSFFDPRMFNPAVWFAAWSSIGALVGLVMVRDPVRIFELPFPPPHHRSESGRQPFTGGTVGFFSRTPLAKLPSGHDSLVRRLYLGDIVMFLCACVLLFVLTAAEIAPYAASQIAQQPKSESPNSPQRGVRLEQALRLFPLSETLNSELGDHYRLQAQGALDPYPYKDRMESAYLRAIALNRYDPTNYDALSSLYRDTSNADGALNTLVEGVQNNPNELMLRLLLIIELEKSGNLPLATHHVKQSLFRIAPNQTQLFLRLAELYYYRGQPANAIWYYQYARQVVPETPQAQKRMQRLREQLKLPA